MDVTAASMRLALLSWVVSFVLSCTAVSAAVLEVVPNGGATGSIQWAVEHAHPGDTVLIENGVYRETVHVGVSGTAARPIVIEAASGAHPVITGADLIPSNRWTRVSSRPIWGYRPWTYHAPTRILGNSPVTYVTEQVVEDGALLRRVGSIGAMGRGTFFSDPDRKHALFVWLANGDSPAGHRMEASVRPLLMNVTGSHIVVRGLTFRFASNNAQQPACRIAGDHNLAEDCTVEYTGGEGAALDGDNNVFRRVTSRNNGQIGMGAHGVDNALEDCRLEGNNTLGFPKGWEAGGIKVTVSRRFRIRRCVAAGNNGAGFWFDIDNRDGIIEDSWAADNRGPGIMVEISSDMRVRNNVSVGNGLTDEPGAWNNAGILLAEAMRTVVDHNVCVGNRTGIEIRQQGVRKLPPDPSVGRPSVLSYYSDALTVTHNISAYNREWQFALFGDNVFFSGKPGSATKELALLNPDRRHWQVNHNLVFAPPGAGLILWGAPWRPRHRVFSNLQAFQKAHQLGQDSVAAPPGFVNRKAGDFMLQSSSAARAIDAGLVRPLIGPAAGH